MIIPKLYGLITDTRIPVLKSTKRLDSVFLPYTNKNCYDYCPQEQYLGYTIRYGNGEGDNNAGYCTCISSCSDSIFRTDADIDRIANYTYYEDTPSACCVNLRGLIINGTQYGPDPCGGADSHPLIYIYKSEYIDEEYSVPRSCFCGPGASDDPLDPFCNEPGPVEYPGYWKNYWYIHMQNTAPKFGSCPQFIKNNGTPISSAKWGGPTPDYVVKTYDNLGAALCVKPANFECNPLNRRYVTDQILNDGIIFKELYLTGLNLNISDVDDLRELFGLDFPEISYNISDNKYDDAFIDLYYPYNFRSTCDYDITLLKKTYSYQLQTSLITNVEDTEFVEIVNYKIPKYNIGYSSKPLVCVINPIIKDEQYGEFNCKDNDIVCPDIMNWKIIHKNNPGFVNESSECCPTGVVENFCCNTDFIKKFEADECVDIKSENRDFNFIHCVKNSITNQEYVFDYKIPVCLAIYPPVIKIDTYDVVLQGSCDNQQQVGCTGSGDVQSEIIWEYDGDNYCLKLNLKYNPPEYTSPTEETEDQPLIIDFYYCEIRYKECADAD